MAKPNQKGTPEEIKERAARQKIRREKDQKKAAEMKIAKAALTDFAKTAVYAKLPDAVKDAITLMTAKAERARGANWMDLFDELFPKVGVSIKELDLFIKTKMGRGEFRKKVNYAIKKAEPENRFWVKFDEKAETWTCLVKGENAPKGWE